MGEPCHGTSTCSHGAPGHGPGWLEAHFGWMEADFWMDGGSLLDGRLEVHGWLDGGSLLEGGMEAHRWMAGGSRTPLQPTRWKLGAI